MVQTDVNQIPFNLRWRVVAIGALALVGTLGCQSVMWRGQDEDSSEPTATRKSSADTKYIGDATAVWGMNFAKIENICLVTQLKGTGSDPPPSGQRERLIKEMQSHQVQNAAKILASKTTSMAIVAANLPPGIRKGDRFDVYVEVMPNSETTSLRGGFIMPTHLRSKEVIERKVREGRDAALAKGRILVREMFEGGDHIMRRNSGYIFGGGVSEIDRPIGLAIRDEAVSVRTSVVISRAINARFTTYDEQGKIGVAEPKNNRSIELKVPEAYRQNIGRFVRVVVNMAYDESAQSRINRIEHLERELQEPALAKQAAERLEAIGRDAIPALKRALQNDDFEVRFYAAEALTYMDQAEGISVLRQAAEREPNFRWHALTALASSEELDAGIALTELFHSENAETRYGAFRAMFARSPNDPVMACYWAPGEYYLHVVPTTGSSMIHFSMQNRAEVVVFGGNEPMAENFVYVETGLTVKATGPDEIELIRYLPGEGESKLKCKNTVADLIKMMADAGCDYESMFTMCKEAQHSQALPCRVVINRVPKSERLYNREFDVGGTGVASDENLDGDEPVSDETEEMPSLFDAPSDATLTDEQPNYPPATDPDAPKKGFFATMKSWFTGK